MTLKDQPNLKYKYPSKLGSCCYKIMTLYIVFVCLCSSPHNPDNIFPSSWKSEIYTHYTLHVDMLHVFSNHSSLISYVHTMNNTNTFFISNKRRNKNIKSSNGNGTNSILVAHWNLGATHWKRKVNQIQLLVDEKSPDFLFLSEANLYNSTADYESLIQGYKINKPLTVAIHNHARLVLLSKDGIKFKILKYLMDNTGQHLAEDFFSWSQVNYIGRSLQRTPVQTPTYPQPIRPISSTA